MSSSFGERVRYTVFGESHGPAIGIVIDGLPAGEPLNMGRLQDFLSRRAPGRSEHSTRRQEADTPEILSGFYKGKTTGAPLCAIIRNTDARSGDYEQIINIPRPGHGDYTGHVRYQGHEDPRGGGHFSGRLTAPLCVAGGIAMQILERRGVAVGAHIADIGGILDVPFDPVEISLQTFLAVQSRPFPVNDSYAAEQMQAAIAGAKQAGDSLGGIVECCAIGMPPGVGNPMFGGMENRLAQALFGIPAVVGVEFGAGFRAAHKKGSQNNDPYYIEGTAVKTRTNHHGGNLGGITTGMPILVRAAIKPTPSIGIEQDTVDIDKRRNAKITVSGRHDPCIVPRAVPVVEAVMAAVLLDLMMETNN